MSTGTQMAHDASAYSQADWQVSAPEGGAAPSRAEKERKHNWRDLIDELLRIQNLEDDWDGEGSEAPPPTLVHGAIKLAQHLEAEDWPPADRVVASVNGTIYFEWHTPVTYLEVEVVSPVEAECRLVRKGSSDTETVIWCL